MSTRPWPKSEDRNVTREILGPPEPPPDLPEHPERKGDLHLLLIRFTLIGVGLLFSATAFDGCLRDRQHTDIIQRLDRIEQKCEKAK